MFFLIVPCFAVEMCECSCCVCCYFIVYVCYYLLRVYELFLLFIVFLLILCTLVSYCFDLTAYCNPAWIMKSSIFSPVSTDNGSMFPLQTETQTNVELKRFVSKMTYKRRKARRNFTNLNQRRIRKFHKQH
jgi:hypothetical protein